MSDEECIPPKRAEDAAVEVRVIGAGDSRGRDAAQRVRDEGEFADSVENAKDMRRLGHGPAPLEDGRRPAGEGRERRVRRSRSKRRIGLRGVTFLLTGVTILSAVGVVFLVLKSKKEPSGQGSIVEGLEVVDEQSEDDVKAEEAERIYINSERLLKESGAIFAKYFKAESVDEVVGLIRDGERLKPLLKERWKPMGEATEIFASSTSSNGQEIVVLRGKDSDDAPFKFILVSREGGLQIDWEASRSIGDVEFDELKNIELGRTVKMRVMLGSWHFHPLEYPDDEFRCFRIGVPGLEGIAFGYARMESEVVKQLSDALNEGTVLLSQVKKAAVIVNLKNGGRGEFGEFEISDVLQIGWIEP